MTSKKSGKHHGGHRRDGTFLCGDQGTCDRKSSHKRKDGLGYTGVKASAVKAEFLNQKYEMEDKIVKYFPEEIKNTGKPDPLL